MKRIKRHKVKTEAQETSTSHNTEQEAHDLAYYIHDRVELMHQVFSVIKYKELKAMAPACIRHISLDDLQELCTEELLGISSKRLCAILDGAEPPSDTESSSPSPPPEQMETISLDSISSDDEILSQSSSKKKKHKHRRHSKSKTKRKKSKDDDEEADRSKASRAGLTVLELLELQARARAIRAQLQQEQQHKPAVETAVTEPANSSDNEVEIKEEPAEVVEISSDEEKPKVAELQKKINQEKETETQQSVTVTKRINDLVITVPQKSKQKIKLNRNKSLSTPTEKTDSVTSTQITADNTDNVANAKDTTIIIDGNDKSDQKSDNKKDKTRKKKKHKKKISKDDIDNDEITLQLSDTEKMDLLEDLDRKNYDSVSSCSSSSSESSSESDAPKEEDKKPTDALNDEENKKISEEHTKMVDLEADKSKDIEVLDTNVSDAENSPEKITSNTEKTDSNDKSSEYPERVNLNTEKSDINDENSTTSEIKNVTNENNQIETENVVQIPENVEDKAATIDETQTAAVQNTAPILTSADTAVIKDKTGTEAESQAKDSEKNLSEGELSDRESSEIEALDLKPEVVCISDEEGNKKSKKKKKKKDKKSKKEKKSKKKSDFRESADQNFYKDSANVVVDSSQENIGVVNSVHTDSSLSESQTKNLATLPSTEVIDKVDLTAVDNKTIDTKPFREETTDNCIKSETSALSDYDVEAVYEILELSDDSSCCEVECSILSKEPTALEIEALSAKIDEIDRVEVITDREIREYERREELEDAEKISWKDRYLDSKKVKKVLNTTNILNALRKKNRDLKKKLAESKQNDEEDKAPEPEKKEEEQNILEEGSIEQFNTLEALTTYVDPVKEVSKDLKKDAKLLLKMYKKLLKYNDINREDDPSRKKKKKKKKKAKKDIVSDNVYEENGINENIRDITKEIDVESNKIVTGNKINVAVEGNSKESKTYEEYANEEVNSENREDNSENIGLDKIIVAQ